MIPLRAARSTFAVLAGAVALTVGAACLPDNAYQRWQLLDGTIHANARWIYERSVFDPRPIDVAIIGPSRVQAGVSAPRLEQDLRARGLSANVVNFSLPENGRNIGYAIAETLLKHKKPKLLIIGVIEKPGRIGHPAFKYIAPKGLVADPAYPLNINYLSDLIYLPFRQLRLFAADVLPGGTGLAKQFDPGAYRGETVDTTGNVTLPDGTVKNQETPASAAELHRGVTKLERGMHPPILPKAYADAEFGDERVFTRRIVAMAHDQGTDVVFLFLPYYTGTSAIQEQAFYSQYGPVWNAGFISHRADLFADYAHLTRSGAAMITDWLTDPVAGMLKAHGSKDRPAAPAAT